MHVLNPTPSLRRILSLLAVASVLSAAALGTECEAQDSARVTSGRNDFVGPVFGMHFGGPQRFALAFGLERGVFSGIDGYSSRFALAEGGLGGGKLVAGVATGSALTFWQVRGALLRTWRDPDGLAPDQSFAGLELRFTHLFVTGGIGQYWRVSRNEAGDGSMLAATIGIFH